MVKNKVRPLVKVVFELGDDWHGFSSESVWAEKVSNNRCKLKNSPFYVKDVSLEDVIFVNKKSEGHFLFESISLRGGHSTYRIVISKSTSEEYFEKYWNPLKQLGCSYEAVDNIYSVLAVDVPSNVDIYEVYERLSEGEKVNVWDFEEGHCGHTLR